MRVTSPARGFPAARQKTALPCLSFLFHPNANRPPPRAQASTGQFSQLSALSFLECIQALLLPLISLSLPVSDGPRVIII